MIFHEYTHFYLVVAVLRRVPAVVQRRPRRAHGLREVHEGHAPCCRSRCIRVYEARDGDWIPFERLIEIDHNSPEYQSHKLADSFYAQAWLTVHYGLVENREFGGRCSST